MTQAAKFPLGAAAFLGVAGLALRLAGARGDLAQDEITSLNLVGHVDRIDEVFWAINVDNSHILNSAWLFLIGPDAPPLAMRAMSIAFGMAAIFAAGLWARGRAGAVAAMALFATSPIMVQLGSEARGYAGLVLFTILSMRVMERALEGRPRQAVPLAACIGFGYLCHYDMCFVALSLGLACLWARCVEIRTPSPSGSRWTDRNFVLAMRSTAKLFALPAIVLALEILPLILFPASADGIIPFDGARLLLSFAASLHDAAHLYDIAWAGALGLLAVVALYFRYAGTNASREKLYFALLVVTPALILIARLPNFAFPRHFLVCDVALLLLLANGFGQAWNAGKLHRRLAIAGLAILLAGNALALLPFLSEGRGHYSAAVAAMTANGPTTYAVSNPEDAPVRIVDMVNFYSRHGVRPQFVSPDRWCAAPPSWVLASAQDQKLPPVSREFGPDGCASEYARVQVYPYGGINGLQWTLYRRP